MLLEIEPRHVEFGRGPVLLSPRHTATLDAHPLLVWTKALDALEYEIKIRGPVDTSIRLAARDLHCGAGSGPWRGLDICSWAPAGKWPALEPGKTVSLSLSSRRTLTASFPQAREQCRIHLLPVDDQRSVQERLRQIDMLPMDKASHLLLTAGAYAQAGLYADAVATYDEALQAQDVPEARVTLGDLYLSLGLTALAEREYRQVLVGAPDSAAGATAELGLGQVSFLRNRFDEARSHFERATELYASLGLSAEAEDARAAAVRLSAP
ncbi:MAG TPA: tetratricopeptide repeat protein [Thermoanaerobaculia bacterium]|nr:tetratricopeptide repeat protein [Thermoanaerobaculia bacterium]